MEENKIIEYKGEILRKIKERLSKTAYEIFGYDGNYREHEEILHLEVQQKEDYNLYFTVAIGSNYLRIAYVNDKGKGDYKKFMDLDEMCDFIENYLAKQHK